MSTPARHLLLKILPRATTATPTITRASLSTTTRSFHTTLSNMVVHNISSKADFDKAIKENKVVILDCSATWCGPCKMISPVFDKMSDEEANSSIYFAKFDVDEVPDLAQELGIRAMPTFQVFKDGEKAEDLVGANPPALTAIVAKHIV